MSNFTEKMRIYAEARANGVKGVQAALLAGYSEASARIKASQLNAHPEVQKRIAQIKREIANGGPKDEDKSGLGLKKHYDSPLDFMLHAMNNSKMPAGLRFEAAKQALPYCNPKVESKGKKGARQDAAHQAMNSKPAEGEKKSRYAPTRAPNVTPIRKRA